MNLFRQYNLSYEDNDSKKHIFVKAQSICATVWGVSIIIGSLILILLALDLLEQRTIILNSFNDFSVVFRLDLNKSNLVYSDKGTLLYEPLKIKPSESVKYANLNQVGILTFEMKSVWWVIFYKYIKLLFLWAVVFAIIDQIKRFTDSLSSNVFFSQKLVRSIKNIGTVFTVAGIIIWMFELGPARDFFKPALSDLFTLENGNFYIYDNSVPFSFLKIVLPITFLVVGQLFYMFSYFFKHGLKLQQENDLTV